MAEIVMPRLSDTMEEGTILRWIGRDGEHIRRGQELVEIETDKATMVYESDIEGVLRTVAQEGQTLAVGELIAHVGEAAAGEGEGPAPGGPAGLDAPGEPPLAHAPGAVVAPGAAVAPAAAAIDQRADGGGRVKASPLARRVARERGVDLGGLRGSGPGGRIVRADVQAAQPRGAAGAPPREEQAPQVQAAQPRGVAEEGAREGAAPQRAAEQAVGAPRIGAAEVASAKGETTEVELSRAQHTIARRMAESKATIPHFALEAEVDMEDCVALRAQLKGVAPAGEPIPTYNDMVVKACALALRAHPRANASYRDGRLAVHGRVNVGVAVATEGDGLQGGTLVVPTVFDADRKALGEIAREARALAARVRDGSITPPELSGGTFTVSNLGMFAVRSFTAIINPPQAAILSVGAVRQAPVARDGGISLRHTMSLTLACDHRVLYGADAARFLAHIRELLERPAALAL
jgi:pyruvate dehydrogenase E2 component (dihydrolipoamide acetyltransferase)